MRVVFRKTVVGDWRFDYLTPKMTTTQVVKTSVTTNSLSKDYPHPDDHTKEIKVCGNVIHKGHRPRKHNKNQLGNMWDNYINNTRNTQTWYISKARSSMGETYSGLQGKNKKGGEYQRE